MCLHKFVRCFSCIVCSRFMPPTRPIYEVTSFFSNFPSMVTLGPSICIFLGPTLVSLYELYLGKDGVSEHVACARCFVVPPDLQCSKCGEGYGFRSSEVATHVVSNTTVVCSISGCRQRIAIREAYQREGIEPPWICPIFKVYILFGTIPPRSNAFC